jgi:hypothetical protein
LVAGYRLVLKIASHDLSLNKSKRSGLPRTQMQAERNKHGRLSALEFARYLGWFDNYLSLNSQLTSYCLDPTVAMACA